MHQINCIWILQFVHMIWPQVLIIITAIVEIVNVGLTFMVVPRILRIQLNCPSVKSIYSSGGASGVLLLVCRVVTALTARGAAAGDVNVWSVVTVREKYNIVLMQVTASQQH